jgi:hypothetical protein
MKTLKVGDRFTRNSDGRLFEIVTVRNGRMTGGTPYTYYLVQDVETGYVFLSDERFFECYSTLVKE